MLSLMPSVTCELTSLTCICTPSGSMPSSACRATVTPFISCERSTAGFFTSASVLVSVVVSVVVSVAVSVVVSVAVPVVVTASDCVDVAVPVDVPAAADSVPDFCSVLPVPAAVSCCDCVAAVSPPVVLFSAFCTVSVPVVSISSAFTIA